MASSDPSDLILRRLDTGTASSPELQAAVGLSQSAVSRQLRQLMAARKILRIGSTRGARYGSLRSIEGIGSQWPVHRVDPQGNVQTLGALHALAADEYYFEPADSSFAWGGVSSGLCLRSTLFNTVSSTIGQRLLSVCMATGTSMRVRSRPFVYWPRSVHSLQIRIGTLAISRSSR